MLFEPRFRRMAIESIGETDSIPVASKAFLFRECVAGGKEETDADGGKNKEYAQNKGPEFRTKQEQTISYASVRLRTPDDLDDLFCREKAASQVTAPRSPTNGIVETVNKLRDGVQ